MATTKFLDYTGLSKLVEKIKNTYVRQDSQYEANLKWGGKNFANSYGPIDAAMIPDLGANRFDMGAAEGITIEYSNDAGVTWEDYGTSDFNKVSLISSLNNYSGFCIGKTKSSSPANDMLRVTIDTSKETGINSYFTMNKVYVHCSTNGSTNSYCTIQAALQSTPTVFTDVVTKVPISGWTGYNIINTPSITTYGNSPSSQYGRLRFIFGNTGNTSDYSGLTIMKIKAYGNGYIRLPGNLARLGVPYTIEGTDSSVEFPANVTATQFVGSLNGNAASATKIGTSTVGSSTKPVYINSGTPTACNDTISVSITGNAATATKATNADNASKVNSHTVNSDVPANAKFTDTVYSLPVASEGALGGIKLGYYGADRKYPLEITRDGKAYVTVPWSDTDTTYTDLKGATTSTDGTHGLVPAPTKSDVSKFLKGDGTWGTPVAAVPSLSANSVENILSGSTNRYSGFLDGDGLQLVVDALKALMNDTVEVPFASVEIMNFAGSTERVAIKMSQEIGQTKFFDNFNNLKFMKFNDMCVFTGIGVTTSQGFPVFRGSVVDQMQGVDDMVAWISNDGTNFYIVFDGASNVSSSGFLDDAYTPTSSEIKLTWDN